MLVNLPTFQKNKNIIELKLKLNKTIKLLKANYVSNK